MELKQDFYYSEDHEWINATPDEAAGKTVRVGITHVAADRLGESFEHADALVPADHSAPSPAVH